MLSAVLSPGAFGSAAQPHFDFRFHTGDRARVEAIAPGRCGELVDCGTFVYGACDGEVIFWEPMITLDLLRDTPDSCLEIRQPEAFQRAGYYPTQYCVRQDRVGRRTVSLERFRYSEAL
jgi:hypothetical protein